ncbi:GntR family transcriptional regulator [Gluconacetobacter sp. Hr-1-5]|uniref:GntR family transcriptional regulator n=1 Tax=Gluconacetobacter sp. Hr-1-5 TaxID=3395370 RepID=UPI003B516E6F
MKKVGDVTAGKISDRRVTEEAVRKDLLHAIFELRIPPGSHLVEDDLACTFGVSRTIIRQAIGRLCQDGIFVKKSNHGTYVASPNKKETIQILKVRRIIEPEIVKTVISMVEDTDLAVLRAHIESERLAREKKDRGVLVRLTGEFHLILADLCGNPILARLMTELQALTCLCILQHAKGYSCCPDHEHARIADAIQARDKALAVALMTEHLDHVEQDLGISDTLEDHSMVDGLKWIREKVASRQTP